MQNAWNMQSVTVHQRPPVTVTAMTTTTHLVCLAVIAISRLLTPRSQVLYKAHVCARRPLGLGNGQSPPGHNPPGQYPCSQ